MRKQTVRAMVNGTATECEVEARTPLADMLRNELGLRGTKVSCGVQICGSCTVLVDGLPVSSCTYLAVDVDQREVLTIEGVASKGQESSIVQDAFIEAGAIQCGYCTPGYVLTVTALLDECPEPSDDVLKHHLDGNICRCTGYEQILDAARRAARARCEARS